MKYLITLFFALVVFSSAATSEQARIQGQLPDNEHILVTVFLKHDQSMNNIQRRELLAKWEFNEKFPPEGVEIVNRYVMMGIGQVIVMRLPPDHLRLLNRAIEHSAWGAYQTEFYITYDLLEARSADAELQ